MIAMMYCVSRFASCTCSNHLTRAFSLLCSCTSCHMDVAQGIWCFKETKYFLTLSINSYMFSIYSNCHSTKVPMGKYVFMLPPCSVGLTCQGWKGRERNHVLNGEFYAFETEKGDSYGGERHRRPTVHKLSRFTMGSPWSPH